MAFIPYLQFSMSRLFSKCSLMLWSNKCGLWCCPNLSLHPKNGRRFLQQIVSIFVWSGILGIMASLNDSKGSGTFHMTMVSEGSTQSKDGWRVMGNEEKKAALHEEMKRMNQLPANSSYASHRLRVINKVLSLMSLQVQKLNLHLSYFFIYLHKHLCNKWHLNTNFLKS